MQEYKTVGTIKYPQNLDSEKQALIDMLAKNYAEEQKYIDDEKKRNLGNIRRGSALSAISGLPVFNIPYVGTGIGGAMYDLGQGIAEGDEAAELAKRAARGFAIGETVGAIPYAGKLASKTKVGQATGEIIDKATEKFINSKAYDALMREFAPLKSLKRTQAWVKYKKLGTDAPNFKNFYEGAALYDKEGKPLVLKHGTPRGGFDAFDLAKAGESNSNEAKLGIWFGDENSNIAENFANNSWWGRKPQVYKTYANIKNPKIYDIDENNYKSILEELKNTRLQNETDLINGYKPFTKDYIQKDFDKYLRDDIYGYKDDLIKKLSDLSDTLEYFEKNGYSPESAKYKYVLENKFDNAFRGVLPEKQQELIDYVIKNRENLKNLKKIKEDIQYLPSDSYSAFLDDIDRYNTRRTHGLRDHWGANSEDIQNYKQDLINQGYDGIIIKNTTTDAEGSGANRLNQYVIFNPKQIKSVNNSGLFDDSVNSLYDNKTLKSEIPLNEQLKGKINLGTSSDAIKNAYDSALENQRKIRAGINPLIETYKRVLNDETPNIDNWFELAKGLKNGDRNPLKYRGESAIIKNISPKQKEYIFNEVNSTISDEEKAKGFVTRRLHNYDEKTDYLYTVIYDKDGKHQITRSIKIDDNFYDRP